ncbi:MAG: NUDIX hydrolase [Alphaproteobacteria bacterium]
MRTRRYYYDVRQYAVLQNAEGDLLALQLPKHYVPYGLKWTLPGGKMEPRDNPEEGLLREIDEETGLRATVLRPLYIGRWDTNNSKKLAIFYLCRVEGSENAILSEEHYSARWVSKEEALEMDFYSPYFKEALEKL